MVKNIIRILLFVLIVIAALCFDWDSVRSTESFSMNERESPEMKKYLSYLGGKSYDGFTSTTPIEELPSN